MNAKKPSFEINSAADPVPSPNLYIYYLKGRLPPNRLCENDRFLGNWEEDDFSFLFFSEPSLALVEALTAEHPQLEILDQFQMTYAEWLGEEPRVLKAAGFCIVPPWLAGPPIADRMHILLDPGLVFGTGTHPTTHDCLEALQRVFRYDRPRTTLDLGTGTGLLAMAAAALGSRRTVALDLNALAVDTARRNIRRNRMEDRVLAVRGRAEYAIELGADLVVANIHHEVMLALLASPGFRRKRWFILSGLLTGQARDVTARLGVMPAALRWHWSRDGIWHTLAGQVLRK